jgi:hypothetical protein
MNNKHQENGALRGPLIFTLPASSFVVILSFDWLDGTDRAAVSANWNYLATRPRTAKEFASGVLNEGIRIKRPIYETTAYAILERS